MAYTDETLMPFGKWKGYTLLGVPAEYFVWLWSEGGVDGEGIRNIDLRNYIRDNLKAFELETDSNNQRRKRSNR